MLPIHMRRTRPLLVAVILAAAAIASAAAAGPAAAVIGLKEISPSSGTAACSAGLRVLSAGARTSTGSGHGILTQFAPNRELTAVTAGALKVFGRWHDEAPVVARAVCASVPQRVSGTSWVDSQPSKAATAACPPGTFALGGGGGIAGATAGVRIESITHSYDFTRVTVAAEEDAEGQPLNWSVTAHAVCAVARGLQRVEAWSASDSTDKSVTVTCPPAAPRVLGIGGGIIGGQGRVMLDYMTPDSWSRTVTVRGAEDARGYASSWRVQAIAICGEDATNPRTLRVTAASVIDSTATKSATATCPSGMKVIATGADIGAGRAAVASVVPHFTQAGVTVVGRAQPAGTTGNWSVRAHAICAPAIVGLERRAANSPLSSDPSQSVVVACPSGKRVVGLGVDLRYTAGEVTLTRLVPDSSLSRVYATAVEDADGYPIDWNMEAYALCAYAPSGLGLVTRTSTDYDVGGDARYRYTQLGVGCGAGKVLLGGGVAISRGTGAVALSSIEFEPGKYEYDNVPERLRVQAGEDVPYVDGEPFGWSITGHAICSDW